MSKRPDTWMPLYIGDYLADTMHLTNTQHGVYLLLIMAYWRSGSPLPDDNWKLAAIAKATPSEWNKLRPVMAEFFSVESGHWWHRRIDAELTNMGARYEQKVNAGIASAAAKAQRKANERSTPVDVPLEREVNQSQSQSQKKNSDTDVSGGSAPPFDPVKDLWARGIAILGEKQRSLLGKFVKSYGKVAVLAAIIECENEMPVDPAAYFIACLERGKANARNGSAESAAAKLAAWARAEDEPESLRGYSEAAH